MSAVIALVVWDMNYTFEVDFKQFYTKLSSTFFFLCVAEEIMISFQTKCLIDSSLNGLRGNKTIPTDTT